MMNSLVLSKPLGTPDLQFSRISQDGKPVTLKLRESVIPFEVEDKVVYLSMLDKNFENQVFALENWLIGQVDSRHLYLHSSVKPVMGTYKPLLRCKIDPKVTNVRDSSGNLFSVLELCPKKKCEATIEVKCVYYTPEKFGISFLLKDVLFSGERNDTCQIVLPAD
jgi:hypothetical protein